MTTQKADRSVPPMVAVSGFSNDDRKAAEPYIEALQTAGADYVLIPPGTDPDAIRHILQTTDGLLLAGGGDVAPARYRCAPHAETRTVAAARDDVDLAVLAMALTLDRPVLGICRGAQVINVGLGGTLHQHLPDRTPLAHASKEAKIFHDVIREGARSRDGWPERFTVNSFHHQAVNTLGAGLEILLRSPDGVIEAAHDPNRHYLLAVQWHPERMLDVPLQRQLFADFVQACRGTRNA